MTEINKYQNGKIYKIVCNKTNLVYIGSTTQKYLSDRLKGHRCNYKRFLENKNRNVSSFKILENNDFYIELIELFPCNSKDELLVRERYYFDNIDCINKVRPQITKEEEKERDTLNRKKRYENNKDKILDIQHQYYQENKEKIKEHKKIYNKEHKEERKKYNEGRKEMMKEYMKEYRKNNKDKIKEIQKKCYKNQKELKNL